MPKEWTDEEVQKEISEAVQIVRADKIDALIRDRLSTRSDSGSDSENKPPPSGTDNGDNSDGSSNSGGTKKKRSLWWGDTD